MSTNMAVIARSDDWDICRHTTSSAYWVRWRHPNIKPPHFIPVEAGYPYPLSGHTRTRVSVAVAAMLTAWTGARITGVDTSTQFKKYLSSHRRNAAEAGIHPVFPIPQ